MWYLCQKVSYDCTRGDASKFTVIHGRCPFGAINIINLPTNLESQVTHRYSANSFKLHRLPTPRPGQVLGLVGSNGIGKSTALKILSGKMKPNLGSYDNPCSWQDVIKYFRGSELQSTLSPALCLAKTNGY